MSFIAYSQKTQRLTIPAAGTVSVELTNQNQPFEDLSIWVYSTVAGNWDAVPTLNDIPIVALDTGPVITTEPQLIQLPGVFPTNTPDPVSLGGAENGIIPGIQITNNGILPLVIIVNIVARSMGAKSNFG